jgi:4-carboxymuconolactone decarboxylase
MKAADCRPGRSDAGELSPLLVHGGRALAATALGDEAAARRHYAAAVRAGVPATALLEVGRMGHLLAGFPRAIQGLAALESALAARAGGGRGSAQKSLQRRTGDSRAGDSRAGDSRAGDSRAGDSRAGDSRAGDSRAAQHRRGEQLFRHVYGESAEAVIARLESLAPGYAGWVLEDAYGRVLSRPGLAPRERELLTITALAALRCPLQLESHVRGARRVGATAAEVAAAIAAARALAQTTGSRKSGARQTRRRRRQ